MAGIVLAGAGMFAAAYAFGSLWSNAYCYFFIKRESFERFLYDAIPALEKMTEEELNDIQRAIGKDPRKPDSYKWMW